MYDTNDSVGKLLDALAESPDESTEVWGDPAEWPSSPEIDGFRYTSEADLVLLRQLERTPWKNFLATPAEPMP